MDITVTEENFAEVWKKLDLLRRIARIKYQISRFAATAGHLAMLVPILILINGLIVENFPLSYCEMMKGLPLYNETWAMLNEYAPAGLPLWAGAVVLGLVAAIAAYLLAALLVVACYHPFRRKMPEKPHGDQAALLVKLAREARMYANRTHGTSSTLAICIGACVVTVIFSAILLMGMDDLILMMYTVMDVLGLSAYKEQVASFYQLFTIVYPVAFFLVYGLLDHLLGLLLRLGHGIRVPYKLIVKTQEHEVSVRAGIPDLFDDEYAEKRKVWAEESREAGLSLERQGARKGAKEKLLDAAVAGDVSAMEHYARHCIICFERESAMFWLNRFIQAGGGSWKTRWTLFRLWIRSTVHMSYLDRVPEAAATE